MIIYFVLTLAAAAAAVLGFLWLQDASYEPYQFRGVQPEQRKALLLTWQSKGTGSGSASGWSTYRDNIAPLLTQLHRAQDLALVLPFEHAAFEHGDEGLTWDHSVFVLLQEGAREPETVETIVSKVKEHAEPLGLRSIDLMRLQNGLDMFYPVSDGLDREQDLKQSLEYVFSKPEARQAYYQAQYEWSGPAMADLHGRDKAGRFVGFEVTQRLVGDERMPAFDLVHIFGFTPWQSWKTRLFFFSTWNKHAVRVFGEGATFQSVIAGWNKIRLKLQHPAIQPASLTLQRRPTLSQ